MRVNHCVSLFNLLQQKEDTTYLNSLWLYDVLIKGKQFNVIVNEHVDISMADCQKVDILLRAC